MPKIVVRVRVGKIGRKVTSNEAKLVPPRPTPKRESRPTDHMMESSLWHVDQGLDQSRRLVLVWCILPLCVPKLFSHLTAAHASSASPDITVASSAVELCTQKPIRHESAGSARRYEPQQELQPL